MKEADLLEQVEPLSLKSASNTFVTWKVRVTCCTMTPLVAGVTFHFLGYSNEFFVSYSVAYQNLLFFSPENSFLDWQPSYVL